MTDEYAIPEEYIDLFQKRSFGHLATLMPDGSPHVTPVWVDYDGQHILVNTAKGRQKHQNILRDPRVAVEILDSQNPYRYLQVRGRVVEITEEGADKHIDALARKYLDVERYENRQPGDVRIILKIKPENF